jgi:hypothetical protein
LKEATMATNKTSDNQLSLLPESSWRLDEPTRQLGLRGVASAREALRRAAASGRSAPVEHRHRHAA